LPSVARFGLSTTGTTAARSACASIRRSPRERNSLHHRRRDGGIAARSVARWPSSHLPPYQPLSQTALGACRDGSLRGFRGPREPVWRHALTGTNGEIDDLQLRRRASGRRYSGAIINL